MLKENINKKNCLTIRKNILNLYTMYIMTLFAVTCFLKFAPVDISIGEGEVEFEVLEVLQFDSTRKRMSVITRNPNNKELVMFTKGADTAVLGVLHRKFKGRYYGGHVYQEGRHCSVLLLENLGQI